MADGALIVNDRRNQKYGFPLNGTETAPQSQRVLLGDSRPWEHHFVDGRGESVVAIINATRWEGLTAVGKAAGLVLDTHQVIPQLRADCIKLEDSKWAEFRYVQLSLAGVWALVILGRLEVIGLFPGVLVALGLLGYALAALFSGVYVIPWRQRETGGSPTANRRESRPPSSRSGPQKRKKRARG